MIFVLVICPITSDFLPTVTSGHPFIYVCVYKCVFLQSSICLRQSIYLPACGCLCLPCFDLSARVASCLIWSNLFLFRLRHTLFLLSLWHVCLTPVCFRVIMLFVLIMLCVRSASPVICLPSLIKCHLSPVTCHLSSLIKCHLPPVICHLSPIIYKLSPNR